jgi:hypothetical protein
MKATIIFDIECGAKTCASEPGKFCRFLRAQLNGNCSCHLFGKLFDDSGWVQRHPDCLNIAEQKDDDEDITEEEYQKHKDDFAGFNSSIANLERVALRI